MATSPWRIALASEIGTAHRRSGVPCQDYARAAVLIPARQPILVAVISDGAGSASRAEVGSRIICERFIEIATSHFTTGGELARLTRDTALGWIAALNRSVAARARAEKLSIRDYSSTLVAALIGDKCAAFLQIGDGAIVVSDARSNTWTNMFWPQHGEFANTTNFVQGTDAPKKLAFNLKSGRIDEVALFSDGIENLILHQATRSVHAPFFNSIFKPVRESLAVGIDATLSDGLRGYLGQPQVCERTDDDKTLVLASRTTRASAKVGRSAREPA